MSGSLTADNSADWQAGYIAAMSDDPPTYPPDISDYLAFWAGFRQGRAARRRVALAGTKSG